MAQKEKDTLIAELLKRYREKSGLSVPEVVEELKKRNISIAEKTLYGYERGTSTPHVKAFIALCDIYHVSDILGSFGYESKIPFAKEEWKTDQYNDFFNKNCSTLQKIYLLFKDGIPTFENYEEELSKLIPDEDAANFVKFHNLFTSLDESQQEILYCFLSDMIKYNACLPAEYLTSDERRFVQLYRCIDNDADMTIVQTVLKKYETKATPAASGESAG